MANPPSDPHQQGPGQPQEQDLQQEPVSHDEPLPPTDAFPAAGGYQFEQAKKSNTTMIVSIVAVVAVLLGVLGVTGFVAPGFFLSGDEGDEAGDSGGGGPVAVTTTSTPEQKSPAVVLIERIVADLNSQDGQALKYAMCSHRPPTVERTIAVVPQVRSAELREIREHGRAGAEASVELSTRQGQTVLEVVVGEFLGDRMCWVSAEFDGPTIEPPEPSRTRTAKPDRTTAKPPPPSRGTPHAADRVMKELVKKINSGDRGARELGCIPGAQRKIIAAVDDGAKLTLGERVDSDPNHASRLLQGSLGGKAANGRVTVGRLSTSGETRWCVSELVFN